MTGRGTCVECVFQMFNFSMSNQTMSFPSCILDSKSLRESALRYLYDSHLTHGGLLTQIHICSLEHNKTYSACHRFMRIVSGESSSPAVCETITQTSFARGNKNQGIKDYNTSNFLMKIDFHELSAGWLPYCSMCSQINAITNVWIGWLISYPVKRDYWGPMELLHMEKNLSWIAIYTGTAAPLITINKTGHIFVACVPVGEMPCQRSQSYFMSQLILKMTRDACERAI